MDLTEGGGILERGLPRMTDPFLDLLDVMDRNNLLDLGN